MIVTKRALPRRTFLRGAGAAIGLPLLDAMVPAFAAEAPTAKRVGFVYLPNGVAKNFTGIDYWTPKGTGKLSELSTILDAARAVSRPADRRQRPRREIAEANAEDGANGDHTKANAAWLTGVRCQAHRRRRRRERRVGRPDRGDKCSARTPCCRRSSSSIDLSVLAGMCDSATAACILNTLSWSSPTTPAADARTIRASCSSGLFGNGGTNAQRAALARQNRSILDFVDADFARLARTLGPADRAQVDEYLESVREVERRIQTVETARRRRRPARARAAARHPGDVRRAREAHVRAAVARVPSGPHARRHVHARPRAELPHLPRDRPRRKGHHTMSHHRDRPEQHREATRSSTRTRPICSRGS